MEYTIEELQAKVDILHRDKDGYTIEVKDVDHTPHPYKVGMKHMAYAKENLLEAFTHEVLNAVPCAVEGCNTPYADHRYRRIYKITLKAHILMSKVLETLKALQEHEELYENIQEMSLERDGFDLIGT
tara:strand:+ start:7698 stop:8081 length:384 start_codon:yes stop_codon:yes gene_type:complete